MDKTDKGRDFVESQHTPEMIEASGFEAVDDSVHMLEWMRKGRDFRRFVIHDIETELYAQDAGSQLLSVNCKAKPSLETILKTGHQGQSGVVSQLFVTFPISLRVRAASGAVWRLDVEHGYHATSLDAPDKFQLRLNFAIIAHHAEA